MAEVGTHPVGGIDACVAGAAQADAELGCGVLRLPVQRVVVALVAVVEEAAHGGEEGEGVVEVAVVLRCAVVGVHAPQPEPSQPVADVGVAQTAGAVLDVRLQVKERVAEAGVAGESEPRQLRCDGFGVRGVHAADGFVAQPFVEGLIAGDAAQIEQRQPKFGVGCVKAGALFDRARDERHLHPAVPERLRDAPDRILQQW
jgi:hypothetical protein